MAGIQDLLLESLRGSAAAENAAMDQESALNKILTELQGNIASTTKAVDTKAQALGAIEGQALRAEQSVQEATRLFGRSAGADVSSPEQILIGLGEQLRQETLNAQQMQQTINEKRSRRLIDSPLDYLSAHLTLDADYAARDQSIRAAELASVGIAKVTKAVDEVGKTQAAMAQKVTDTTIAAAANARIAEAEATKAAATRNHLKDEMVVVGAIQNASAARALEAQRQYGMVKDAEQFEMEKERFAFQKEQWNWEKQIKELNAKSKQEADDIKKRLLAQYNVGAQVLGLPAETSWEYLQARHAFGGIEAARISAALESGGNSAAVGSARATATPAGAAMMIAEKVYPRAEEATFAPMKKYLKEKYENELFNQGGKKDAAVLTTNAQIKKDEEAFTKNAVMSGSFYAPPPIAEITATKSVQSTALYQRVLSTAGKDLTTAAPTPVLSLAYEAAKKGTITYEEAAKGLQEFYGQAIAINNVNKRFAQVGIKPQTSMNVKPDIPGVDNVHVNLVDYSSILHLFAITKAREDISSVFYAAPLTVLNPNSPMFKAPKEEGK